MQKTYLLERGRFFSMLSRLVQFLQVGNLDGVYHFQLKLASEEDKVTACLEADQRVCLSLCNSSNVHSSHGVFIVFLQVTHFEIQSYKNMVPKENN